MKNSNQLGFMFEIESEEEVLQTSVEEQNFSPLEIPEQTFLLPELEEEAKSRAAEEELPWDEYASQGQVQLIYFDQFGRREYKELLSKAAICFGTKNASDTVMEALRRAAR